ncbi:MAG: GTA-gp10 family protein [Hyphomicrobiaceae bacterium]
MLNKQRGEAAIDIGGKTYTVALTLDALARSASALGIDGMTFKDFVERVNQQRADDMPALLSAILAGNGHNVPDDVVASVNAMDYLEFLPALFSREKPAGKEATRGNGKRLPGLPETPKASMPS